MPASRQYEDDNMAKQSTQKIVETLTHDNTSRKKIPTVEYQSVMYKEEQSPIPQNPLIAKPLLRIKYVEKAGTGTTDMVADCRKERLPEPDFEQHGPHFVVTLWRDWLTDDVLAGYNLNDRQKQAVKHAKGTGRINKQCPVPGFDGNIRKKGVQGTAATQRSWYFR
jgi:predicted HTH transcriptional regulator